MLKTVIIDHYLESRNRLQSMLGLFANDLEVVAVAGDALSGIKSINVYKPDLVFLDIDLPKYSGFKLLECFDEINFDFVFTTQKDNYAIRAFRVSAAGYLLKPVDETALQDVCHKIIKRRKKLKDPDNNIDELTGATEMNRIVLPVNDGLRYIKLNEILYLESEGRYTQVYDVEANSFKTQHNLKACLALIKAPTFMRIHRSFVINLLYIKQYVRGRDSHVILDSGTRIDVGKNYKEELNKLVSYFLK